jgi:ABC-type multidrug transport system fused ATPase/permease subunit
MKMTDSKPQRSTKILFAYSKKQCTNLFIGNLALLGGSLASFMIPLMLGYVIDAMNNQDWDQINQYCLWMLYIVVISSAMVWVRGTTFNTMSEKLAQQLRYDFFYQMMNKDIPFFDEHRTGEILSRMSSDISVI